MNPSDTFDPYRKWLGIPPAEQPPNHYRLLGVGLFEDDADTIAIAADRQMAHLRTFQIGPHAAVSQKLLNELAAARIALLDTNKKAAYDLQLRAKLAESAASDAGAGQDKPAAAPVPIVPPVAAMRVVAHAPRLPQATGEAHSPTAPVGPIVAPLRRGPTRRSRPNSALLAGMAAATAVLAAVIYVTRQQVQEDGASRRVALEQPATRPRAASGSAASGIDPAVVDSARASADPQRSSAVPDDAPPKEAPPEPMPGASRNAAAAETADLPPAVDPSAERMPAPSARESDALEPPTAASSSAEGPTLADLLRRGDRPQIASPPRHVLPDGKAQAAAAADFARLYGKDMANAKNEEAKRKLSFRLLNLAQEGIGTPDIRYLLLGKSGFLAAYHGNVGLAYRAAAEVSRQFDVDPYALELDALEAAGKRAAAPAANAVGVLQAMALAQRAAAEGKHDVASKAADQAVLLARKTKDKDFMASADRAKAALRELSSQYAAYQKALAELKKTPASPDASLAAGKYELLVLGAWPSGLTRLAASAEPRWAALAKGEALARGDLSQWASLAAAWWQIAELENDDYFGRQARLQAKYCYLRAKSTGRAGDVPVEIAEQLRDLPDYPLSRLRPGVAARYYEGANFQRQRVERVDASIDFFFGLGSPDPSVPNNHFSARWTGFVKPPIGGRYQFVLFTNDSVRLWIDGRQVLDRWGQNAKWQTVDLDLSDEAHTLRFEYNETFEIAIALFGWVPSAFAAADHSQWSRVDALYYDPGNPFELPEMP